MQRRSPFALLSRIVALVVAVGVLVTACSSGPEPSSDRPDQPAPIDGDFRSDSGSQVAHTGKPQLVEFFAYW